MTSAWRLRATRLPTVTKSVPLRGVCRDVGAEVDDAHVLRAEGAAALGDPLRVGEDELRGPQRALDDRAAIRPLRRHAEHVAAVDADDHRLAEPSHGVARGGRVVRMDEIERFQRLEHERERRRRPRAPGRVRARPRRRDERRVGHADAVERRAQRLLERRDELAQVARLERRLRRHGPVQHHDLDVRARVPRRERLAVRPHPERRVRDARVVLRDDHDPHTRRYSATVSPACVRVT